jgi:hypothetical protein
MPIKAGFGDRPCFSVRKAYQASHCLPGLSVALVGDVKASPEQLDFRLGLVVPVTASPRPRLAGSRRLRNNHDASPLALDRVFDPVFLVVGGPHPCDRQARLIHQEVIAVESMPGGLGSLPTQGRDWRRFPCPANCCRQTQDAKTKAKGKHKVSDV